MNALRAVFWNAGERRVRAGWRVLLQFVLRVLCLAGLARVFYAVGIAAGDSFARSDWMYVLKEWTPRSVPLRFVLATVEPLAAVVSAAIACRYLDKRPLRGMGYRFDRRWWMDYGFGLAFGVLAMALVFGAGIAFGWLEVRGTFAASPVAGGLGTAVVLSMFSNVGNGLEEELADRGYALRNAAEGFTSSRVGARAALVLAWALTSVQFGLAHMGRSAPPSAIGLLVLVGVLFGLPYVLTGELAISMGIHTTWNFSQQSLFGLAEGRSGMQGSLVAVTQRPGAAFWIGDASWGPESGALCLAVCALGMLAVWWWVRATRGVRAPNTAAFARPAATLAGGPA